MKTYEEVKHSTCPKCDSAASRVVKYKGSVYLLPLMFEKDIRTGECMLWRCQGCGYEEASKPKDAK